LVDLPNGKAVVKKNSFGPRPMDTDTSKLTTGGTSIDGKELDSSKKNGGPFSFPVNGVVRGWSEALKLMPVGSAWKIYIPPDLTYGSDGAGEDIAPRETLIFDG
jgi:FKBP-type peptidyl-prolyl cis-trans isomerase